MATPKVTPEQKAALGVWCPRCFVNPGVPCKGHSAKKIAPHILRVLHARRP